MKPLPRNRLDPTLRRQLVIRRHNSLAMNPQDARKLPRPRQQKARPYYTAPDMLDHRIGHLQIDSGRRRPVDWKKFVKWKHAGLLDILDLGHTGSPTPPYF
jgi:hypothetical protein